MLSSLLRKKTTIVKLFTVIFIFSLFLSVITISGRDSQSELILYEGDGVCDISDQDFSEHGVIIKANDLDFYPNQYLSPNETKTTADSPYAEVQYATQRIVFQLPDESIYSMSFHIPGLAGNVFVNGKLVKEIGQLGTRADQIEPGHTWCMLDVVPLDGKIELVIQSANFLYENKSVELPRIYISLGDGKMPQILMSYFQSVFVFGGLIMAALLLIGMWMFYPYQIRNIWFGLLCLVMAARTGLTNQLFLWLFPDLSYLAAFKMETLSTNLVIFFLVLYFECIYPGIFQKTPRMIYIFCSLYGLASLLMPPLAYISTYKYTYPALGVFLLYSCYRFFKCFFRRELTYLLTLTGIVVLIFFAAIDLALHMGLLTIADSWYVFSTRTETGLLIFALLQIISIFIQNTEEIASVRKIEKTLIMEKKALEETNRMKTEFLANISHELKSPLTVMSACAQSAGMLIQNAQQEQVKENLDAKMKLISSEAKRLSLMVEQILTATQIEEHQMFQDMKLCYMDEIVHAVMETYYPVLNKNNNRLNIQISDDIPPVMGDEMNLSRVLVNLISNAIRHTQDGMITVSVRAEDGFVVTDVTDTGSGISPEHMEQLFKRFHSYSGTGTGLGLYICKHIVKEHAGDIAIKSQLGKGTQITVRIPCTQMM